MGNGNYGQTYCTGQRKDELGGFLDPSKGSQHSMAGRHSQQFWHYSGPCEARGEGHPEEKTAQELERSCVSLVAEKLALSVSTATPSMQTRP